ncbi:MAG: hypothetical protein ACFFCP_14135 [Promethearchaeota archaeon]
MKTRWIQLIAGLTMVVLCISVCTTTTNATEVWNDYFDNEDLPGWTIFGWSNLTASYEIIEGNFSAASGRLTSLDNDVNIARHDSDTNVGTWSFDMYIPEDASGDWGVYVYFMSNGSKPALDCSSMVVAIGTWSSGYGLVTVDLYGYNVAIRSNLVVDSKEGWHHIEVSRSSTGRFLVEINENLLGNYTSNSVTNSTYLEFFCNNAPGAAIDNLIVDNDPNAIFNDSLIDITTIVIVVAVVAIVAIVLVVIFFKRK